MQRLQLRFSIENVGADMVEIVGFPWDRIYTTNYDNAIEISLMRSKKNYQSLNNLDYPSDIVDTKLPVIHLHGRADAWNIRNFEDSCVLGADSYHLTHHFSGWLDTFRQDIDRAKIVVFVGFNASDFHLNEILRNVTAIKEKVFFINRVTSNPDPDVDFNQSRFGSSIYFGRTGLAEKIREITASDKPVEPSLSSFMRYKRAVASSVSPGTRDIENLFIFGEISEEFLARDVDASTSEYRVALAAEKEIINDLNGAIRIALVVGDICQGKTICLNGVCRKINVKSDVFVLGIAYDDLVNEISLILRVYPEAVFVIENCFELSKSKLIDVLALIEASSARLILTSRTIAAEARADDVKEFKDKFSFKEFKLGKLNDSEIEIVISLCDQIAGWSEFKARNERDRKFFIKNTCDSNLPSFLMRLLKSEYVKSRYREEYNKIDVLRGNEKSAIVAALYVSHIGERPLISFMSDIFEIDFGGLVNRLSGSAVGLRLLRSRGDFVETVPSIGATNILRELISDDLIVDAVTKMTDRISRSMRRDSSRQYVFSQIMRYSIIKPVIDNDRLVETFFDKLSKISYVRRLVLFWLQWSIALREQGKFVESARKLDQAYREAEMYESTRDVAFDRKQLEDVKAKLMIARSFTPNIDSPELFREVKGASEIVIRLLRSDSLTHHPYETLEDIARLYREKGLIIDDLLRAECRKMIDSAAKLGRKRLSLVPVGYQSTRASHSLNEIVKFLA